MQTNLLQSRWSYVERKLRVQFPRVPPDMWQSTHGMHDAIVRLVRDVYAPGRSEITVEAEVRDLLNRWVGEAEGLTS